MKTLATNKKAFHDYEVLEKLEAGIQLQGTEVKSCRAANISLADAHAVIKDGELWLTGVHIAPYAEGNRENHEPRRLRRLLMHKREIRRLKQEIEAKGMALIPLRFYLKNRNVKVELALGRGKAKHDKRETLKQKMDDREARRAMKR